MDPGEGELMMTTKEAFERVCAERGITTWSSFVDWRKTNEVPVVDAVRVADLERALAEGSGTRLRPKRRA